MSSKKTEFLKRVLIFQFVFLFIYSKVRNLPKSLKDFTKRVKFITKHTTLSKEKIEILINKSPSLFLILFALYFLFGIMAICNNRNGKTFSTFLTFIMAWIYCNPLSTRIKYIEKHKYDADNWKSYIPSLEFCVIAALGVIMELSSSADEEEKKNENEQKENKNQKKNKKND